MRKPRRRSAPRAAKPAASPPTNPVRQRVNNAASLTINQIRVCLGRQDGTETGNIHFEIWSATTTGGTGGQPSCPDQQIGGNSDAVAVGTLAVMGTGTGDCGMANNGEEVTITWTANTPTPSGIFWIVGFNDDVASGQVRWGAWAINSYEDGTFNS